MGRLKEFTYNLDSILKLIEKGYTISKALKYLNIHRSTFYSNVSESDKLKLNYTVAANKGRKEAENNFGF